MIDPNETLGRIAATHPESTRVFLRHRLDFCCGGTRKLADACGTAGLDPRDIVAEIDSLHTEAPPERWDDAPLAELIELILARYHEPLRADLEALLGAARKVERVHAAKASCPRGLTSELEQMDAELRQHLAKEEQVLFPAIVAGHHGTQVHMPVRVMMQEHDDHGASLRRLRVLCTDYVPPAEACPTWRALYAGLAKLESELMEHIHLENNVLFPRALAA
jgi:regulator of cell morphogenesis and NO signaling